jgi:CHAT domain-containing protein
MKKYFIILLMLVVLGFQVQALTLTEEKQLMEAAQLTELVVEYYQEREFQEALPLNIKLYAILREILGEEHPYTIHAISSLAVNYKELGMMSEALPFAEKSYALYHQVLGEKHQNTLTSFLDMVIIYRSLNPDKALSMAEKAYDLHKEVWGERHRSTLSSLNTLAGIYYDLGRFVEAVPLNEKIYVHSQEIWGTKHLNTLASLDNLILTYKGLGYITEALTLAKKSYNLYQEVLDKKHPDTLNSLSNLANIYHFMGNFTEALPLMEKAYALRKEALGEKHPDTLISEKNLVEIYNDLGRFTEILPLAKQTYVLSQEVFGSEHPNTLMGLSNLALTYISLGRADEALPLIEKAYTQSQKVLGERHLSTLIILNNLAETYQKLGRVAEALPLIEKAYIQSQETLGEKDIYTLTSLANLAKAYNTLGETIIALSLAEKHYLHIKNIADKKHPYFLKSLANLANIYQQLGRSTEAMLLNQKAYAISHEILGEKHIDTLSILNNLAETYRILGNTSEALSLNKRAYTLRQKVLGEKHPDTLASLANLALTYYELNHNTEALSLNKKAHALSHEILGEKHPTTLSILSNLALSYYALGFNTEALPLNKRAYTMHQKVLGDKHPNTLISLNNLAQNYAQTGQFSKAISYSEQLIAGIELLHTRAELPLDIRRNLMENWYHAYFNLSALYLRTNQIDKAFVLSEKGKARTLLDTMALRFAVQNAGLTLEEQKQWENLNAHISAYEQQLAESTPGEDKYQNLSREYTRLYSELADLDKSLQAKYPKFKQLRQPRLVDAKAAKKLLPADSLFISYLIGGDNLLAFVINPEGTLVPYDLGEIPHLAHNLELYRSVLGEGGIEKLRGETIWELDNGRFERAMHGKKPQQATRKIFNTSTLSEYFGDILLKPLSEHISSSPRWIISPSGELALLPFETLVFDGKPVLIERTVSYIQSLSVLSMLQERKEAYHKIERETLLAMGAARYEATSTTDNNASNDETRLIQAQILMARGQADLQTLNQAVALQAKFWSNLPGTARELDAVEKIFADSKPRIYREKEASEAKLLQLNREQVLSRYRYLLFATHGDLNAATPALSALVLDQLYTPEPTDGYVTAAEWVGYDLRSDLMVLSACDTGRGESVNGEGVLGLPYALYIAGNTNTLMTLWAIEDQSTAEFTNRFFTRLKAGEDQIQALNAVKREFMADEIYGNPLFWAAFVLYGV